MTKLKSAISNYDDAIEKSKTSYSGILGLAIGGHKIVNHPTRAGYVYVRLRDNLSEVVQAFNDKVSPVYNFPVLIQRRGNKWYVTGRDDQRYENWGTSAPFLPKHGDQHSFNRDGGGGGDTVAVFPDQFMPLLVHPSGTYGASNLLVAPYVLQRGSDFTYVSSDINENLLIYKPTDNQAIMGLVYLDTDTGVNGFLIASGTPFDGSVSGTAAVVPYLPYPAANQEPLYGFRLVSGTTSLTWDNLYNVRQFIGGGGGVSDHESLTGLLGGAVNDHYHLTQSQLVGLVSGSSSMSDYVLVQRQETNGTDGGENVADTWTALDINTEVSDTSNICTVATSQITLAAGTYDVDITASFYFTLSTIIRLYNIDDSSQILISQSLYIGSGAAETSDLVVLNGRFTIAASKTFEIQYLTEQVTATFGLGVSMGSRLTSYTDSEVFVSANFRRIG